MFWTFKYQGKEHVSWGKPTLLKAEDVSDVAPYYSLKVYGGEPILPGQSAVFVMQGDSTLGIGDSIWLISYMRDIYSIKGRRRCKLSFASTPNVHNLYKLFLPKTFSCVQQYLEKTVFDAFDHKLPSMYFWKEDNRSDKSWVDNRSILSRMYAWSGMQYDGLPDFGDFTDESVLYPGQEFFRRYGIDPDDRYVMLQWHSSGACKNPHPRVWLKVIRHVTKTYGLKVYVAGTLKCLDELSSIPGVVNLSGKSEGRIDDLFTLGFRSEFIVCPDSVGIHIAEAYRIPAVVIMSTLPPNYVAYKYRMPSFMFGSGKCPYRPCGELHAIPKDKCPGGGGYYCRVVEDIDIGLFDRCVVQSFENRAAWRRTKAEPFYQSFNPPISIR